MHISIASKTRGVCAVEHLTPSYCNLYLFHHAMIDSYNALHYILCGFTIAPAM